MVSVYILINLQLRKITVLLLLSVFWANAQKSADLKIDLSEKINQIHLNQATGITVAISSKTIYGINTNDSNPLWTINLDDIFITGTLDKIGKVMASASPEELLNSGLSKGILPINDIINEFVEVQRGSSYAIIDVQKGAVLMSSKQSEAFVFSHFYIPEIQSVIMPLYANKEGTVQEKSVAMGLFSLKDRNFTWKTELSDGGKFIKIFNAFDFGNYEKVSPRIDANGDVYLYLTGYLMKLDHASGKLVWGRDSSKYGVNDFFVSDNGKYLIQLTKAKGLGGLAGLKVNIMVADAKTGVNLWKEPIKIKTPNFFEDWGDAFLLASYNGFNVHNYVDFEKKWKKGPKGQTKRVIKTDGRYIFIEDTDMHFILENGEKKWKKKAEISDNKEDLIFALDEYDSKIVFVTSTYANIVDRNTGKLIWKKNLKFNEKRPVIPFYDEASGNYYIYNDEELFKFNIRSTERPDEFSTVKIKKEKEINNFKLRSNGDFVISGEREIAIIGSDGVPKLQKYYPEAGNRRLFKSMMVAGSIVSGIGGATYSMTDGSGNVVSQGGAFYIKCQCKKITRSFNRYLCCTRFGNAR